MNTWSRAPSQVLELAGFAAVFWAMSAVPIVFEEGFQRDAVKLIELPGDLADALEAESRPLVMRGSLDDNVVIVTDRKTFATPSCLVGWLGRVLIVSGCRYAVNLVETSNTVLLVRPSADAHTLGVHSVLGCHYEMIETVPDLARVRSLLREHEIGNGCTFGAMRPYLWIPQRHRGKRSTAVLRRHGWGRFAIRRTRGLCAGERCPDRDSA